MALPRHAPTSSRDFQRAAKQRYTTAEFLLAHGHTLDAMYLGGYAIECSLKALILHHTLDSNRMAMVDRTTRGRSMHDPEVLAGELRELQLAVPRLLMKRIVRSTWSPDLRYLVGRADTGETRGFLKTAGSLLKWVDGELQ